MTPGTRLHGRFELGSIVGSGGVATVWKARDLETGSTCALKILHPHLRSDAVLCERFRREVEIARSLSHPAIVRAEALFEDADGLSFSMPLLEGRTLKQTILAEGALSIDEALRIACACLEGLEAAHAAGVIHRDLKPQNVFLCRSGEVKLLDFGFARVANAAGLTTKSLMLCTPDYAAPELVAGHPPDGRADLYALGVLLFEALTGELPYRGLTPFELLKQHLDSPVPDLRLRRRDVPPTVAAVVQRLLAKAPELRFATCEAARLALAAPPSPRDARPVPFGACASCGGRRDPDWPLCPSCGATPAGGTRSDWMVVLVRAPPDAAKKLREAVLSLGGVPNRRLAASARSVVTGLPRVVVKGIGEPLAQLFRERCQAAGIQVELRRFTESNADLLYQSNTPSYLFLLGLAIPWGVLLALAIVQYAARYTPFWGAVVGLIAVGGPAAATWVARHAHRVLPALARVEASEPAFALPPAMIAEYRLALETVRTPALRGTLRAGWERFLVFQSAVRRAPVHVQMLLEDSLDASRGLADEATRLAVRAQDALQRLGAAGEPELWASLEQAQARLAVAAPAQSAQLREVVRQKETALEQVGLLERSHLVAAQSLLRVTSALELAAVEGLAIGLQPPNSVSVQLRRLREEVEFARDAAALTRRQGVG